MDFHLSTPLDCSADAAWAAVQRLDTFLYVTRGVLGFAPGSALPETLREGETVAARLVLFGFVPGWRHEIRLERVDDARRELRTREAGAPFRVWNHRIHIVPMGEDKCYYTDSGVLEAGPITPIAWFVWHLFFRYRHFRWRRLARTLR